MDKLTDNKNRRCEICNWSFIAKEGDLLNSSGLTDDETVVKKELKGAGPRSVAPTKDGRFLCTHCKTEELENIRDFDLIDRAILTDAGFDDSLLMTPEEVKAKLPSACAKRLTRYEDGGYIDEVGNQLVFVKTYRPSHPKIRKVVDEPRTCSILEGYTAKEQADWIEEYSKSLAS